jgi:hypothetical protein
MTDKPQDLKGYHPDVTEDCERVLVTLLSGLGPWKDSIYLVGGLAPRYIVPADPERPAHAGTADVDIVVRLSVLADTKGYKTLEENLERLGFSRVPNLVGGYYSWRWQIMTDNDHNVVLEFLTGDLDGGRGELEHLPIKGGKLNACNFPVLHLVYRFNDERIIKASLLGGKGIAAVKLRHADAVSFLCAKADAFGDRGEEKDAHDIAYCLENMEFDNAVEKFKKALSTEFKQMIQTQLDLLKTRFCSDDSTEGYHKDGPRKAAMFELPVDGSEDLEELRTRRQRDISGAAERLIMALSS